MTVFSIRIRQDAFEDIREIYLWIAHVSGSKLVAEKFTDRIFNRIEELEDFPMIGVARLDLGDGLRHLVFEGKALIIYRVMGQDVHVTNVLYRGRDTVDFVEGKDSGD
jgi:plasmid stabilization system protein ParE